MSKTKVNFRLPVTILKEGNDFVAYSPALDISTVGSSFEEAQERFDEMVEIFFEELAERGTIDEVLQELGWVKKNTSFTPPVVVSNQLQQYSFDRDWRFAYA